MGPSGYSTRRLEILHLVLRYQSSWSNFYLLLCQGDAGIETRGGKDAHSRTLKRPADGIQIDVLFAKKEFKPLLEARLRQNVEPDEKASKSSGNQVESGDEKRGEVEYREAAGGNA